MSEPIFVFRPIYDPKAPRRWLRYEPDDVRDPRTGTFVPDDGRFGLAFLDEDGPFVLYVDLHHRVGIEWAWSTRSDTTELRRPIRHYRVRDPEEEGTGRLRPHPDTHPNVVAGRAAMDECCRRHSCANGRGVRFHLGGRWANGTYYDQPDPTIAAGLVRALDPLTLADLGEVTFPAEPACFRCANDGFGHKLEALAEARDELENELETAKEQRQHAQTALYDAEDAVEHYAKQIRELETFLMLPTPEGIARERADLARADIRGCGHSMGTDCSCTTFGFIASEFVK